MAKRHGISRPSTHRRLCGFCRVVLSIGDQSPVPRESPCFQETGVQDLRDGQVAEPKLDP